MISIRYIMIRFFWPDRPPLAESKSPCLYFGWCCFHCLRKIDQLHPKQWSESSVARLCCSIHTHNEGSREEWLYRNCVQSQIPAELLGLALLHCLRSCNYRQGRLSYVPQHQSVRVGAQPCGRAVSYRLHPAFACYRNNITSWTIRAHIGLLLPFSTSVTHLFRTSIVMFWKEKKIHIYIQLSEAC